MFEIQGIIMRGRIIRGFMINGLIVRGFAIRADVSEGARKLGFMLLGASTLLLGFLGF